MVYISEDGHVLQTTPWSLKSIFGFFRGIVYMVVMFVWTLVQPGKTMHGTNYARDYRPGSGPPRPPTRRMGRPNTGHEVNIPFGGCSSCAR